MYTHQLINLLKKDVYSRKSFCGVLPIDKLPIKRVRRPCSFIINTHNSQLPGEHWMAVYLPRIGDIEYFDSYGLHPMNQEILDFIKVNNSKFIYNSKIIQSSDSQNCGKFCLFYLYFRNRGLTMKQYLKFFTKNKIQNDYFINLLYKKIIKKNKIH